MHPHLSDFWDSLPFGFERGSSSGRSVFTVIEKYTPDDLITIGYVLFFYNLRSFKAQNFLSSCVTVTCISYHHYLFKALPILTENKEGDDILKRDVMGLRTP